MVLTDEELEHVYGGGPENPYTGHSPKDIVANVFTLGIYNLHRNRLAQLWHLGYYGHANPTPHDLVLTVAYKEGLEARKEKIIG